MFRPAAILKGMFEFSVCIMKFGAINIPLIFRKRSLLQCGRS